MTDARPDPASITSRDEFAAGLSELRRQADLSIRELSRLTDIPSATLGGYFSGRNLPQPGQVSRLRAVLAALGLDEVSVDAWVAAADRARSTPAQDRPRGPAPYPGLTSYDIGDVGLFFGRTRETEQIVARLRERRDAGVSGGLLAVVGPSGSGKTSLLRAGVAAALAADPSWSCVVRTPTATPLAVLDAVPDAFDPGTPVLILDQFEEVFTSVTDAERAAVMAGLAEFAAHTVVLLGMRADFYAVAAREPLLVPALQDEQFLLGPLAPAELRQAIEGPAGVAGLTVEPALLGVVLAAMAPRDASGAGHDPGALPLLSHALRAAWQRGRSTVLTLTDYQEAGGVDGAVARTAEEAYARLTPAQQDLARALLLRLVNIDDVAVTRRRIDGTELAALRAADFGPVIDEFVGYRLLTAGADSIAISHEALLAAWPRLRSWLEEDRLELEVHRQVTEAANAWDRAGRDDSLLPRGTRLDAATELLDRAATRTPLTGIEREFVVTAGEARDAEVRAERQRTRVLRRLLIAVAVLFLVASGLAVSAFRARTTADDAQRDAATARDNALSGQLALQARELRATDPALAQQFALAAYRTASTPAARSAMAESSADPVVTRQLGPTGRTTLALSPDGGTAAVGLSDGDVRVVRPSSGHLAIRSVLPGGGDGGTPVSAVAWLDAGTVLAGNVGSLTVWDVRRPARVTRLADITLGGDLSPAAIAVQPGSRRVLVGGDGKQPLQAFDLRDPRRPSRLAVPAPIAGAVPVGSQIYSIAWSPDGRYLAVGGDFDHALLLDTRGTAAARPIVTGAHRQLALRFVTGRLYVGDSQGVVSRVDPATAKIAATGRVPAAGWAQTITVSPDGRTVGVGYDDSTFRSFDATSLVLRAAERTPKEIVGAAFVDRGTAVLLTCADGNTYLIPRQGDRIPTPATTYNLSFDTSGSRLLAITSGDGGGARVWDVRGTVPTAVTPFFRMTTPEDGATGGGALSPDGTVAAVNNFGGDVQLFDLRTPAAPRAWAAPFPAAKELVESLAFSPDGTVLALASDDKSLSLWDVRQPARPVLISRRSGPASLYDVTWSTDGRMLATAGADGRVTLWSVLDPKAPTLRSRLSTLSESGGGVAFNRSGTLLAGGGSDGRTRVWDLRSATPRPVRLFVGPTDSANGLGFSPDGKRLAVSSNDSTVRLYDLRGRGRTPILTLDAGGPAFAAQFSPDGRHLIGSGRADSAPVWTVDPATTVRMLCERSGDALTRTEWQRYIPDAGYMAPCG